MRWIGGLLIATAACGSGSKEPTRTSGPIQSIVHFTGAGVQLYASHHLLELDELPVGAYVGGLPLSGTIELGANVNIPLGGGGIDARRARGRLAFRCVGRCQLGDDRTRLSLAGAGAAFAGGDLAFSHLDLTGLEAHVEVERGHVRLTRWKLTSEDLLVDVDLDLTLADDPRRSPIEACIRYRPTDALRARDPQLHSLLSLASPVRDPDDRLHLTVSGTVANPRVIARECGDGP